MKKSSRSFSGQMTSSSSGIDLRLWRALGGSLVVHGLLVLGGGIYFLSRPPVPELPVPVEVSFRVAQDVVGFVAPASELVPEVQTKESPPAAPVRNSGIPLQKKASRVLAVDSETVFSDVTPSGERPAGLLNVASTVVVEPGSEAGRGADATQSAAAGGASHEKGSSAAREDVLREYRGALIRAARKVRRYPPLAREQGWEGVAQVRVTQESGGGQLVVRLEESSRYGLLDDQALVMLQKAVARAPVPESLVGQSFTLMLPVEFSLDQH